MKVVTKKSIKCIVPILIASSITNMTLANEVESTANTKISASYENDNINPAISDMKEEVGEVEDVSTKENIDRCVDSETKEDIDKGVDSETKEDMDKDGKSSTKEDIDKGGNSSTKEDIDRSGHSDTKEDIDKNGDSGAKDTICNEIEEVEDESNVNIETEYVSEEVEKQDTELAANIHTVEICNLAGFAPNTKLLNGDRLLYKGTNNILVDQDGNIYRPSGSIAIKSDGSFVSNSGKTLIDDQGNIYDGKGNIIVYADGTIDESIVRIVYHDNRECQWELREQGRDTRTYSPFQKNVYDGNNVWILRTEDDETYEIYSYIDDYGILTYRIPLGTGMITFFRPSEDSHGIVVPEISQEDCIFSSTGKKIAVNDYYIYWSNAKEEKIKDFIKRLYANCFNRETDESGLSYWSEQLSDKTLNASDVLESFLCSKEFEDKDVTDQKYIEILYDVCMDRTTDKEGLNYWLSLLQNGYSRKSVLASFTGSTEFSNICNAYGIEKGSLPIDEPIKSSDKVVNFVQRFYQKCLGRAGDEAGISYWVDNLKNNKFTGQDIAENFILSSEFKCKNLGEKDYLGVLYKVFFDRTADINGLNYWLQLIANGTSKKDILQSFIDSEEFTQICNTYGIIKKRENPEDKAPARVGNFEFKNGIITKYVGNDKDVIIPTTINGEKVVGIGGFAFYGTNINSVIITDGSIDTGVYAFGNCLNLESIIILDEAIEVSDSTAGDITNNFEFYGCVNLKYLKMIFKNYSYEGGIKMVNDNVVLQGYAKLTYMGTSLEGLFENNEFVKGKVITPEGRVYYI